MATRGVNYKGRTKITYAGHKYECKHVDNGSCHVCDLKEFCLNDDVPEDFQKLIDNQRLACLTGNLPYSHIYVKIKKV